MIPKTVFEICYVSSEKIFGRFPEIFFIQMLSEQSLDCEVTKAHKPRNCNLTIVKEKYPHCRKHPTVYKTLHLLQHHFR